MEKLTPTEIVELGNVAYPMNFTNSLDFEITSLQRTAYSRGVLKGFEIQSNIDKEEIERLKRMESSKIFDNTFETMELQYKELKEKLNKAINALEVIEKYETPLGFENDYYCMINVAEETLKTLNELKTT